MKGDNFNKEVDKIITNQYIPDENKFSDYLKFKEEYPKGDYSKFRKYCQEKDKGTKK